MLSLSSESVETEKIMSYKNPSVKQETIQVPKVFIKPVEASEISSYEPTSFVLQKPEE